MTNTNATAADFITRAIEAGGTDTAQPSEYDIDAIARQIHAETGSWDMGAVDHEVFWAAVARGAKVRNLIDADDGTGLGPATPSQREASAQAGATGVILIDGDGDVIGEQDAGQPWVPQPVRRVYVER